MKKEEVLELIRKTNEETNLEGERIANQVNEDKELNTWFQKWSYGVCLLQQRGKKVMDIQKELREQGWDIKIDMQSYELSYYGKINKGV